MTVPTATGSGRFTLITPHGTAVSTADFFIPPSPYTAADVQYTGRMSIGGSSHTVTINTATKIGLVVFDGLAGQKVSLVLTSSTFSGSLYGGITIYKPDGTQLTNHCCLSAGLTFRCCPR
jgi:hypothetical protein